jgi:hypothetical protein
MLVAVLTVAAAALALASPARAADQLTLPLFISSGGSPLSQFGYAPEYTQNVPAFDSANRPYIRSRNASQDGTSFVHTLDGGAWRELSIVGALTAAYPDFEATVGAGGYASDRIVFDRQDRAYTVLTIRLQEGAVRNVLLCSLDRCATWTVHELPYGEQRPNYEDRDLGNVACESFTGHNLLDGPPLLAVWRELSDWPGAWASRCELSVIQPFFDGDRLVVPQPTPVTTNALGMMQSAGGASFAATSGGRTAIVWTEITATPKRGSPTFVGVYDHASRAIISRTRVFVSRPANDVHATPGICLDSQGIAHVVSGAHNRAMHYTRSLTPLAAGPWTPVERIVTSGYVYANSDADGSGRLTYLSLVCDAADTLHVVARQMRRNASRLYWGSSYMSLVHLARPADGAWGRPRLLAVPADGATYANYHQKLAVDRLGRLYLSLSFRRNDDLPSSRPLNRFRQRMVLFSPDGRRWEFATTETFRAGIVE